MAGLSGLGSGSTTEIDVTNFASTAREYLQGFIDNGSVTVNINVDPDAATWATLESIVSQTGITRQWRILLNNSGGAYWEFSAYIATLSRDFAIDDAVRATMTLRVTGRVYFVP